MIILGISAYYHDSAAALIRDGEIISAAQEERFSRKKFDPDFPALAIRFCLEEAGITISDLDMVVFYDKPWLKFERLLDTYLHFAPRGLTSFLTSMPVWLKDKIFLKDILVKELKKLGDFSTKKTKLLFSEHHLSHAASAFFASPFDEALIVTIDGVGEWSTASIGIGKGNKIQVLKEMHFPHSVGLLYSAFTYFLGFRVNSGEYKLMGLAPYGIKGSDEAERFKEILKSQLVNIKEDGSIVLNQHYFSYAYSLRMLSDKKWKSLFGISRRLPESSITEAHANLALAIQEVTEEIVLKMLKHAITLFPATVSKLNLCLAGGVALNCVANGRILRENLFKNIFVQPAAGDAGGALGAALAGWYIHENKPRIPIAGQDSMKGSYLGPEYSGSAVRKTLDRLNSVYKTIGNFEELAVTCARLIAEGNVIAWFQGKMEFGPRALGNRSILGDPRNPGMQKKMNLKIKFREGFRPFAPAIMEEHCGEYFDPPISSPYMMLISHIVNSRKIAPPGNSANQSLMDRLYFQRSDIPAVTHIDYSARLQTVSEKSNPAFYSILNAFYKLTGCPVLINTSFNVRGEPIVCSPEDAYRCFINSDIDYLVIGNFLLSKLDQPINNLKKEVLINSFTD
jgi:carbamoyltransferase